MALIVACCWLLAASTTEQPSPALARVLVERIGGDSVAVSAFVTGGVPPFRYEIHELGVEGLSDDGWIVAEGSIGGEDVVRILVTDGRNAATEAQGDVPAAPDTTGNE